MVSGVPFNFTETDIVSALKLHGGNIRAASRVLGCSHLVIYEFIEDHPHLKQKLAKIRAGKDDEMLSLCENQLAKAIMMMNDRPRVALDAVKFYLDRKGKSRGYGVSADVSKEQSIELQTSSLDEVLRKAYEAREVQQEADNGLQRDEFAH